MKCLAMIVEADPSVLARPDMKIGVNRSFLDQSTAVREAAVDLVGKFVLSRPELIDKYYEMLSNRILVSVGHFLFIMTQHSRYVTNKILFMVSLVITMRPDTGFFKFLPEYFFS